MIFIAKKFENFGLKLAENKTETMTWNTTTEIMEKESIITVNGKELKNVREFRYLGHKLTNELKPKFLTSQIGLAYSAWNEHKKVLTDQRIKLWIRVQIAESLIRSRLVYALQTDRLKSHEKTKVDSIWTRMCRKMVKGGFRRQTLESSNEDSICKTSSASVFCEAQHLRFIGHIARMDNDSPQKQWLFAKTKHGHTNQWISLARDWNMEPTQIRRTIATKQSIEELLNATT